jgi:hypothetical protein
MSRDLVGGCALIALGAFALHNTSELSVGTLANFGPGMLPRIMAILIIVCGLAILPRGLLAGRESITPWKPRGIVAFLGAVVVFGATIRGIDLPLGLRVPALGMIVAIPLATIVASLGSRESRGIEVVAFAAAITLLCTTLFKLLLRLPIPLAPWLLGY